MESEWEYDSEWVDAALEYHIQEQMAGHELIDSLDQLIQYACISEERKERLYEQIHSMSLTDCISLYTELKEKQIDRVSSGLNYNQGQLIEHLKKLT